VASRHRERHGFPVLGRRHCIGEAASTVHVLTRAAGRPVSDGARYLAFSLSRSRVRVLDARTGRALDEAAPTSAATGAPCELRDTAGGSCSGLATGRWCRTSQLVRLSRSLAPIGCSALRRYRPIMSAGSGSAAFSPATEPIPGLSELGIPVRCATTRASPRTRIITSSISTVRPRRGGCVPHWRRPSFPSDLSAPSRRSTVRSPTTRRTP